MSRYSCANDNTGHNWSVLVSALLESDYEWYTLFMCFPLLGCPSRSQAEDVKRVSLERSALTGFRLGRDGSSSTNAGGGGDGHAGSGGPWSSDKPRREASVVLIDRTLDLAASASHGGSLLQRVRYHDKVACAWCSGNGAEAEKETQRVSVWS